MKTREETVEESVLAGGDGRQWGRETQRSANERGGGGCDVGETGGVRDRKQEE